MRLRPDDDIYRAKLLFLGPKGFTLPVHLPYVAYPLFAVVLAAIILIRYALTQHVDYFPAIEIALSIVLTSVILRQVSPDRPVRAVLRTAATDWRRDRTAGERGGRARSRIVVRETIR
ncbi:hypothetical protein [Cryptosporangium sp. NPDC048952]|uniref:hypothetical protein n=1 Tax=Cryptosporangium sp. NPDC048952 TaxID=3363961 RepID=UPI0037196ED0